MPSKIPYKTEQLIEKLYAKNLSVAEIARRTNVSFETAYGYTRVRQRINPETKQPFKSLTEYEVYRARQRQQQPVNQQSSDVVKQRLAELGKTQRWLAQQLEITEGAVSRYISGRTTPRRSLQERLFEVLELPYQTLDDLLEDIELK